MLRPERQIGSADVIQFVQTAVAQHGAPEFIRSDNGPEFIAKELQRWRAEQKIKTIYITPASPWENDFVESFHSRFRDECLNREQLWTLHPPRGPCRHRRLPPGLQRRATAQLARVSLSATLRCGKILIHPRLRAGPPSRSVPPLGIANHHRSQQIHPSQRLTLHQAQFSGPAQYWILLDDQLPLPRALAGSRWTNQ